ncbi:MAG: hypothetical protein A3A58_02755 [Candidatus Blackburnbacteria bacterium RIFCSPLOWO2_01_FULL_41_27]|uniref:Plasmid stabilization protein n=2 Tax=Candidatus Blackburniibacteriota TaxID=1817898 RepID=A0A1G1V9J7_9BACT|nr:MAG: hypothetical protein A3F61_04105 [Candidatus Blackburnbacteria bacterium RIFCSPHIGHO2_12_FULL_41_13b]OGY14662.1 MAG: hypothetical protein A3A58_02755 [Candidatus Blackburnbacteria bacterium RIFCSPLOWO2_01_FULL_41_27]
MEISFQKKVVKRLKEIKKTQPRLSVKIKKQLKLFKNNPRHPSLRTHKLGGVLSNTRSISMDRNIRMTYCIKVEADGEKTAIFLDIGTHDEVYKK